jgi:hypothetical protein
MILSVSQIGTLTYKSLMSKVIILYFLCVFIFIRSLAKVAEFLTL